MAATLLPAAPVSAAGSPPAAVAQALERSSLSASERAEIAERVREAARAGIPPEDVEIIIGRGLDRGVDAATLGSFLDTAVRTKQQGLPVRPVLDRVQQGLSKNVPPARIDAASKRLAGGLEKARPLVDGLLQGGMAPGSGDAREAALESVARAEEQSVPDSVLRATGEKVRAQGQTLTQFERTVRTLTFLNEAGMPSEAASRVVQRGVEHGFTERDFGKLERNVNEMVRQGRSMDEIVSAAEREIRESRGGAPESRGRDRTGGGREAGGRGGRGR